MPFVPAPNCVQVELRWTLDSQKCENRFFVDMTEPPSVENMTALSAVVAGWVENEYAPIVNGAITFTEALYTDWTTQLGVQLTQPLSLVGGTSGTMLPNESSFCVSLRTGFRGRSARGRWYMPPPDQAARLGINTLTTTYVGLAAGALSTLIDNIIGGGWFMSVVQFRSNNVKLTTGVVRRFSHALAVDNLLDSQRRRKPGNGT